MWQELSYFFQMMEYFKSIICREGNLQFQKLVEMMCDKLLIFINKMWRPVLRGGCDGILTDMAGWAGGPFCLTGGPFQGSKVHWKQQADALPEQLPSSEDRVPTLESSSRLKSQIRFSRYRLCRLRQAVRLCGSRLLLPQRVYLWAFFE